MTRRQWMWLWIWLLLFFIVFCVWLKLQALQQKEAIAHPAVKTEVQKAPAPAAKAASPAKAPAPKKVVKKPAPPKEEESFTIVKRGEEITISGRFSSEEEVRHLIGLFEKRNAIVRRGDIHITENLLHRPWEAAIEALYEPFADDISEGEIRYHEALLRIEGKTASKSGKELIDIALEKLKESGIKGEERILLEKRAESKKATPETAKKKRKNLQQELDRVLKAKRVTFLTGRAILDKKGKSVLDEVASILQKYPRIAVEIGGHTDSVGDAKRNLLLSRKRALRVKRYLVSKGVDAARLKAVGYGESRPLVKNDSAKHRQMNRRVEFKIIGEK